MKDGDTITTKIIEQDGPIAYTETTSMGELFEEDANRCLLLNTNETPEQTRLILAATAAKAAGVGGVDTDAIRRVHHALVRMLPRVEVIVPYAAAIATHYPVERVESRRSFTHLLKLIQASALLHHLQRARDDHGRVIAADQDYAVAERLARAPLTVAAGGLTASSREYLKALRERFADQNFTQADAQTVGNVSPATRKRRLVELVAQGEVVITLPQSGSRAGQYMVVSRPSSRFPAPDVIPSLARVVSDPSEIGEPLSQ